MGLFSSVKGFFDKFSVEGLKKIFEDVKTVIADIKKTFDHLTGVIGAGRHLFDTVVGEIDAWKHFKEDIRFKSRVINLEKAITKTRDLILGIPASWRAVLDIFSQVKKAIARDVAEEEGAALLAVETAGLSEVVVALTIFYQILSFVADMIQDLQTIVDELQRLRLEVEKLDTIFLQQSNSRKNVKLPNGRTVKLRIGSLHTAADI